MIVNVGRAGAASLDVIQEVEYVKQEAKIVYLLECLQKTSPPVSIMHICVQYYIWMINFVVYVEVNFLYLLCEWPHTQALCKGTRNSLDT